jgi:hypothetical protein
VAEFRLTSEQRDNLRGMAIRQNGQRDKLKAIKDLRTLTGCGLRSAKLFVEADYDVNWYMSRGHSIDDTFIITDEIPPNPTEIISKILTSIDELNKLKEALEQAISRERDNEIPF